MKRLLIASSLMVLSGLITTVSFSQQTQSPSANADSPAVRRARELA